MSKYSNYNFGQDDVLSWLMEDKNPEVKLRVLVEYLGMSDDDTEVIDTKKTLLLSPIFSNAMQLIQSDKVWSKYDAIASFAEWGLTRKDIDIDQEVFDFIEKTKFKPMCGEAFLLRNLVKLGYASEQMVLDEINAALQMIKEDGGFGCLSKSKKINDPKKSHRSCYKITASYLLLTAEMKRMGLSISCEKELIHYFLKRNIVCRTDDMQTIVVEGIENTYYPPDAIKTGIQNILYALSILGVSKDKSCKDSWQFLNKQKKDDGKYLLGNTKTKPCFKVGTKGNPNKWVTLYALMSEKLTLNQV